MSHHASTSRTATIDVPSRTARIDWGVPAALILLGVIPAIGGIIRLASYAPGAAALHDEVRFGGAQWLLVVHIVGALAFALGGALQFSHTLRRRPHTWHRRSGRVVAVGGVVGAVAGLAGLVVFLPHPEGSPVLTLLRIGAGLSTIIFLVQGWRSAVRRDFKAHGRWMMRAYGLGAAAGTQALFLIPIMLIEDRATPFGFALGMGLGFAVNVAVVESILHRANAHRRSPQAADRS